MQKSGWLALAGVAIGFAACAAMADPAPPPPPQGQPPAPAARPAKPDPGQVVSCRDESVTGSIINRKRVCKTKREWDEQAMQTQQKLQDDAILGGRPAGCAGGIRC